jgi:hypothetical protein
MVLAQRMVLGTNEKIRSLLYIRCDLLNRFV